MMRCGISARLCRNMRIELEYSGADCIFLALLCLVLPLDWLLAAVTAAAFHEFCHLAAVVLTGGELYSLHLHQWGAVMEASVMDQRRELLCILAGPAGSLFLLVFAEFAPKIALCGLVQGLFNLMPVYPLDGGRAMSCVTGMLFSPRTADKICTIVSFASLGAVCLAGIYGTFVIRLGIMPVLAAGLWLMRAVRGKIPCKESKLGVQ